MTTNNILIPNHMEEHYQIHYCEQEEVKEANPLEVGEVFLYMHWELYHLFMYPYVLLLLVLLESKEYLQ